MEKFQKDKIFGDIFCRYLKKELGWSYETKDPQKISPPSHYPDVDVVLVSNLASEKYLYLQLTKPLDDLEIEEKIMTRSSFRVFSGRPLIDAINKKEILYRKQKKDFSNIILGLHFYAELGYSIKEEINIESGFRGIYIIEQSHSYSSFEKGPSKEWVHPIKKAFA